MFICTFTAATESEGSRLKRLLPKPAGALMVPQKTFQPLTAPAMKPA